MEAQLEGFLNALGEAERAGGRVLHELTAQAHSLELREMLKKVGHDEGYYAGELSAHVSEADEADFAIVHVSAAAVERGDRPN